MNISSANTFDPTGELCEIGLMAAASPEFTDQMIRALLAAGESFKATSEAADAVVTV
jgi:hypothetical protein